MKLIVVGPGDFHFGRELDSHSLQDLVILIPEKKNLEVYSFISLELLDDFLYFPESLSKIKYPSYKKNYQIPRENLPNYSRKRFYPQCEKISVRPYKNKILRREKRKRRLQR